MKALEADAFFGLYLCSKEWWNDVICPMHALNLPEYPLKVTYRGSKAYVFDIFRKRHVALTPEEWVRQHFLWWLHKAKGYPASLIAVEASLTYNRMKRRADAIIYGKQGQPVMIVECKAATHPINEDVFDQVARYNFPFGVEYLAVTNGVTHFCCLRDEAAGKWLFLEDVPDYQALVANNH